MYWQMPCQRTIIHSHTDDRPSPQRTARLDISNLDQDVEFYFKLTPLKTHMPLLKPALSFCSKFNLLALPLSETNLCRFSCALVKEGLSHSSECLPLGIFPEDSVYWPVSWMLVRLPTKSITTSSFPNFSNVAYLLLLSSCFFTGIGSNGVHETGSAVSQPLYCLFR